MTLEGKNMATPTKASIWDTFELSVLSRPNTEAVLDVSSRTTLTFKELYNKAIILSRALNHLMENICEDSPQNPDGDHVIAVCMEPSEDLVTSLLAILKSSAAYLPMEASFPLSRVVHIVKDSKPSLLLTKGRPEVISKLEEEHGGLVQVVHLEDLNLESPDSYEEWADNVVQCREDKPSGEIAAILYTSGSTGVPKGVRISQSAFLNRLFWQWRTFPYEENEVCCFKTVLTFVDSVSEIFGPLLTGHKLIVVPKKFTKEVDELVDVLQTHKIQRLVLVPTLLRSILCHCSASNEKSPILPYLKLWICSGEVFPIDLLESFFKMFPSGKRICNFYGSTEVMGDVTYLDFSAKQYTEMGTDMKKVPIGIPVSNCTIHLLDENLKHVDPGAVGEIYVSGKNLASGYVGIASSEKFIQSPFSSSNVQQGSDVVFRTGDFGSIKDGLLYFEGRQDSQIKIRGHRVDITEVNNALQNTQGVDKCCTLCFHPGEVDQALLGFYVSSDESLSSSRVKAKLRADLPSYMVPHVIRMDELPLLVNGKVDKQTLIRSFELQQKEKISAIDMDFKGCPQGLEVKAKKLLETVVMVLGASAPRRLSLGDNFFDIGGNSLNALMTITALHDVGCAIGVGEFMRSLSLLDMLTCMDESKKSQESSPDYQTCQIKNFHQQYKFAKLESKYEEDAIRIMKISFLRKGDLEKYICPCEEDYRGLMKTLWDIATPHLSFMAFDKETDRPVAVCINTDLHTEEELIITSSSMAYIFSFLEDAQEKVLEHLPEGQNTVFHCQAMNTVDDISAGENVGVIIAMEMENIRLARQYGYKAILTTNTSALTKQVCEDFLGYKVLNPMQANKWVAPDGEKPYSKAPDDLTANVAAKFLYDVTGPQEILSN